MKTVVIEQIRAQLPSLKGEWGFLYSKKINPAIKAFYVFGISTNVNLK